MSKWIRTGDKVVVIAGNEKGQMGKVLRRSRDRVVIEGLNIRKKHVKAQQQMQGGIVDMESPIHISNVGLCSDDGKAIKVKVKEGNSGERQLYYVENGKDVVLRDIKKKKA